MKKYSLELLKEQCGNDKTFFNEMIDIFIKSSMEGIEKLDEACVQNNWGQMSHYAHKIVSPCRHIEADGLIAMLREIEQKADIRELEPERARLLIDKIKLEADDLIKNLRTEYL